ncbi:P-loop containing nucleoside triphosphate hydrolase protein [Lipomyces japonicus]|uniref:P-loop containing nucleoside triphosphate hydrolase protein n=1 Tax=Lipomyces japonicus TaxID=56871 RepID=UPI0034CE0A7E
MTPVQASSIPLFCSNKDVVVEAVTGSGKTIAYLLPIIEIILRADPIQRGHVGAIIVSPTRELASQINTVLNSLLDLQPPLVSEDENGTITRNNKVIKSQLLVGGTASVHADVQLFLSDMPQILICTPGRLLEFLKMPSVHTSGLEVFVLDEADRLLNLGFEKTLSGIIHALPKQRRTGLFSATITDAVGELVRVGLRNPVKILVKVGEGSSERKVPSTLSISYTVLSPHAKIPNMIHLLNTLKYKKSIVYFPTCQSVVYFYAIINAIRPLLKRTKAADLQVFSLHGKLPPGPRTKTLDNFINTNHRTVLLTTDVAARGLDIPEVDVVIQIDPPYEPNMFLHRAGRAGRAGRSGEGYVFLTSGREESYVDLMKVKKVQMAEVKSSAPVGLEEEFGRKLHKWLLEDRERHEAAVKSYVGYVRFYTKHTMSSIFRISEFNFVDVAKEFGLIRLPSMPELKGVDGIPSGGWLIDGFNMDNYKYKDAKREASRLEALQHVEDVEAERAEEKKKRDLRQKQAVSWSEQNDRKERREVRREKKKTKHDAIVATNKSGSVSDSESEEDMQVDWKSLVSERKRKRVEPAGGGFDDLI